MGLLPGPSLTAASPTTPQKRHVADLDGVVVSPSDYKPCFEILDSPARGPAESAMEEDAVEASQGAEELCGAGPAVKPCFEIPDSSSSGSAEAAMEEDVAEASEGEEELRGAGLSVKQRSAETVDGRCDDCKHVARPFCLAGGGFKPEVVLLRLQCLLVFMPTSAQLVTFPPSALKACEKKKAQECKWGRCPWCRRALKPRVRRSDGVAFLGCSTWKAEDPGSCRFMEDVPLELISNLPSKMFIRIVKRVRAFVRVNRSERYSTQ